MSDLFGGSAVSWPLVKLGDIATLLRGVTFSSDDSVDQSCENYLPVLRAGNIQDKLRMEEGLIWIPEDKIKENQKIKENDIIMCTSSGSADLVGKCAKALINWNGSFGAFCAGIRANPKEADASYLYHFLCSSMFRSWTRNSSGANIKNIRISELGEFRLPLPPLAEQKRIAAILDKADAIRRKRQQAIKLADEFLRSVFLDMFGDPVSNPKGLRVVPLVKLCEKVTDGTHQSPKWEDSGIPFLFISNIVNGKINYNTNKFISKETFKELTRTTPIEKDDILYTTVGSYGNVALVSNNKEFCFQRHIAHIKPNHKIVKPKFLAGMLESSVIKRQADALARGVAQKTLNLRDLKEIRVFDISKHEQEKYLNIIEPLCRVRDVFESSESELRNAFDSLSQKAFSGQL